MSQAIIGVSPLFSRFDSDMDQKNYLVDFKTKPLTMFLEVLYLGQITDGSASVDVLCDLYHLFHQSGFKDLSQKVVCNLKRLMDEKNCSKMLDFQHVWKTRSSFAIYKNI
jgi:hypothetical protein